MARPREALGMRKGTIAAVASLALLAVLAAVGLPRLFGLSPTPAAAQTPPAGGPGIPVTEGTVAVGDVPIFLNGIGTVQASNMVTIKSRVDGQIVRIDFTEGQDVKAGAPLLQIDPRPFQAVLEQAQAAREKDEAQINTATLNLGYADIRSPIDGRLGAKLVDIGNMVRASDATGLVTITQLKPIFVSFTL